MTPTQTMGYCVKAASGEVVMIDGGYDGNENEILRTLKTAGADTVELWFLTHPHCDHHDAVINLFTKPEFAEEAQKLTVKRFYSSFIPDDFIKISPDYANLQDWNRFAAGLTNLYELKKWLEFHVGSMTISVLSEKNPELTDNAANDQSCILMFEENGFKMLFLGDLGIQGGQKVLASGTDVGADAVQMAHHGQNGVNEEFYRKVNPRFTFWPTPIWLWNNNCGKGFNSGPYRTVETRGWIEKIGAECITVLDGSVVFDTQTETASLY